MKLKKPASLPLNNQFRARWKKPWRSMLWHHPITSICVNNSLNLISILSGDIIIKTGFAGKDSKTIQIIVEDSGIGIASEYLEKIFDNFFQVQGGILDKTQGAGLGLSLVRQLVVMHGGRVWAESSGIGNGSRFVVELPVSGH